MATQDGLADFEVSYDQDERLLIDDAGLELAGDFDDDPTPGATPRGVISRRYAPGLPGADPAEPDLDSPPIASRFAPGYPQTLNLPDTDAVFPKPAVDAPSGPGVSVTARSRR